MPNYCKMLNQIFMTLIQSLYKGHDKIQQDDRSNILLKYVTNFKTVIFIFILVF